MCPNPVHISIYGLGSYPFARHYLGNRLFTFFSSGYLDVSVPQVPLITLWIHVMILIFSYECVPAFGHPRISSFATPRGFSQLITSFFGAWCQGIHHTLLLAWSFLIPSTSSFRKRQVNFFRSWFLSWPLFSSSSYKTYLTRFLQQKLFMILIHNTLLIYSYNIICFCFVIQLSMYVVCLLPDFWE